MKVGSKLVIQNAYIAPFDQQWDKRSTVTFQVTLVENSVVTIIGNIDTETISPFMQCELEQLSTLEGLVQVNNAYLRTIPSNFQQNTNSSINVCFITDGRNYIEVRLPAGFATSLKKGDPVSLKSELHSSASPMYIIVHDASNFSLKEGTELPLIQILTANKALTSNKSQKRKSEGNLDGSSQSKMKKSE